MIIEVYVKGSNSVLANVMLLGVRIRSCFFDDHDNENSRSILKLTVEGLKQIFVPRKILSQNPLTLYKISAQFAKAQILV